MRRLFRCTVTFLAMLLFGVTASWLVLCRDIDVQADEHSHLFGTYKAHVPAVMPV